LVAPFPARRLTGGGGPAEKKREGTEGYLWRVLGLAEVDEGGLAAGAGDRRRQRSGGAMKGQLWSGASVVRGKAFGGVQSGNGMMERRRHGKLCSPALMVAVEREKEGERVRLGLGFLL
jgi:hypothetical protein